MPDNLPSELGLISFIFFMFTATTVAMMLLLHAPFLPLTIMNITSCKNWLAIKQLLMI